MPLPPTTLSWASGTTLALRTSARQSTPTGHRSTLHRRRRRLTFWAPALPRPLARRTSATATSSVGGTPTRHRDRMTPAEGAGIPRYARILRLSGGSSVRPRNPVLLGQPSLLLVERPRLAGGNDVIQAVEVLGAGEALS